MLLIEIPFTAPVRPYKYKKEETTIVDDPYAVDLEASGIYSFGLLALERGIENFFLFS